MNEKKLEEFDLIIGDGNYSSKYPKSEEFLNEGIPFLSASDFIDKTIYYNNSKKISPELHNQLKKGHVQKGDILIVVRGNGVGKTGFIDDEIDECNINAQLAFIRSNDANLDNEYLYYNMKYNFEKLRSLATGSAQPQLVIGNLVKYSLSVPSIDSQVKIKTILSNIDNKIKLNNEINNNLYEMGDNLYNEYFGKYKDNLPSDYNIVKLNEVADNFDSKRKPMSSREREQHRGIYPYYGATSIIDYVDDYIFDDTYLLMGEDGTVKTDDGYPVLQYIWGKNWINNHAHVLKGKNISTELLMFALRKINIENIITGAVQPKINQENMNKIEFVIGPDSKKKELEVILKNLMDKSKNIIEENRRLEQLRNTLLPKLMNGEIDLDNIEI